MKLATTLADFGRYAQSTEECIKLVHDAGFRYVDFSLGGRYLFSEGDGWRDVAKHFANYADEIGVKYVQAHSPNGTVLRPDTWEREIFYAKRSLEICRELGIDRVVVHAAWTGRISSKESFYALNKQFYDAILPTAEETGVMILTENTSHASLGEGGCYIYSGADMTEFVEYIDHPLLQVVWDTGHGTTEGSQYDNILAVGKHLKGLHVHDNNGKADQHTMPYMGVLNLDQVMNGLLEIGYDGYFTFEVVNALRSASGRQKFERDTRLATPTLEMQIDMERLLYHVGKHALQSYNCFEE